MPAEIPKAAKTAVAEGETVMAVSISRLMTCVATADMR